VNQLKNQDTQQIFQLCSYLLSYPNQEWIDSLAEVSEIIESLSDSAMKSDLQQFYQTVRSLPPAGLISAYVNTFDFGKKTNLYITYMSSGEQRERGMDLLFLKNYFQSHGFAVTDKELPDYLPVMLEFASQVDEEEIKPVFERYLESIREIENHLEQEQNLYRPILNAVLGALAAAGVTKAVRRSEEICSTNFYG